MSGRLGGRLVVAAEAGDGDVVANHILVGVDAKVERAAAPLQAARKVVGRVNHLVGRGKNAKSRGKGKRAGLFVLIIVSSS